MRIRAFVVTFVLVFVMPVFSQGPRHQCRMGMANATMAKRAEIRVVPMSQFQEDQAAIAKMSALLDRLHENRTRIRKPDAAVEQQLQLEAELAALLAKHLQTMTTDEGKSPTAVAVQGKLNAMEGKMMCGACHGMGGAPTSGM